jgi:hypothetical protein
VRKRAEAREEIPPLPSMLIVMPLLASTPVKTAPFHTSLTSMRRISTHDARADTCRVW